MSLLLAFVVEHNVEGDRGGIVSTRSNIIFIPIVGPRVIGPDKSLNRQCAGDGAFGSKRQILAGVQHTKKER